MLDTLAERLAKVLPETRSETLKDVKAEEIVDTGGTLEEMRH